VKKEREKDINDGRKKTEWPARGQHSYQAAIITLEKRNSNSTLPIYANLKKDKVIMIIITV